MSFRITTIGGQCPVQAEGVVDDKPFYFRSRGEHWSLSIGGADVIGEPEWYYAERYSHDRFAAGYMTEQEARRFIDKGVRLYETAREFA